MSICTAMASAPRRRCHETTRSAIALAPDALHEQLWLLQRTSAIASFCGGPAGVRHMERQVPALLRLRTAAVVYCLGLMTS